MDASLLKSYLYFWSFKTPESGFVYFRLTWKSGLFLSPFFQIQVKAVCRRVNKPEYVN